MKHYTNKQWAEHFATETAAQFDTKPGYQGDCYERFGCTYEEAATERIEETEKNIQLVRTVNESLIRAGIHHMKKTAYLKGRL